MNVHIEIEKKNIKKFFTISLLLLFRRSITMLRRQERGITMPPRMFIEAVDVADWATARKVIARKVSVRSIEAVVAVPVLH